MGRFYIRVEAHTRRVPCDCSDKKEDEEEIEVEEYKEPFRLREDFDKNACVFWK